MTISDEPVEPVRAEDLDWSRVELVTVVCFLADGDAVLIDDNGQLSLPSGSVSAGEDVLVDTLLRVPLETAGFRRQGTHVVAASAGGRHVLFWVDGARYSGHQVPTRHASWWTGPASQAATLLETQGHPQVAQLVRLADRARRALTDHQYFADLQRVLDPAYLGARTVEGGSGFGGTPEEWRAARSMLCDAVDDDVTFLDVGCANGLLMESLVTWAAEQGHRVEPYGLDLSADLVALARQRLPHWADRIWVGNALDWAPPQGQTFDVVHTLLDAVPIARRPDLISHLLEATVTPGGRLLISQYGGTDSDDTPAEALLRIGRAVDGVTRTPDRGRRDDSPSAWTVKR